MTLSEDPSRKVNGLCGGGGASLLSVLRWGDAFGLIGGHSCGRAVPPAVPHVPLGFPDRLSVGRDGRACTAPTCWRDLTPRIAVASGRRDDEDVGSHQVSTALRAMRQRAPTGARQTADGLARTVAHAARTGGASLDPVTRAWAHTRFGDDFGDVRVYSDPVSTGMLGAAALTSGTSIVFAPGRYAPGTASGRRLLAHELAHVRQQRGLTGAPRSVSRPDAATEREAHRVADLVDTAGPPPDIRQRPEAGTVQLHPGEACPAPPRWQPESAVPVTIYGPANRLLERTYRAAHARRRDQILVGSDFLYGGNPESGITLPRGAEDAEFARDFLAEFRGVRRQRAPDIIDFRARTIYEIKTIGYADEGQRQLGEQYRLAEVLQAKHGGRPWNRVNATWFPPHVLGPLEGNPDRVLCTAATEHPVGKEGLILYQVFRRTRENREEAPQPSRETEAKAKALAALAECAQKLRRQLDHYSGDHRIQAELIDRPSFSGFAGYWTNELFNGPVPPQAIWLNAFASLAALDSSVRAGDVRRATESLIRGRREFLLAQRRYVAWKEGIVPAGRKAQVAIGVLAVAAALAFVAPQLLTPDKAPAAEQLVVRISALIAEHDAKMLAADAIVSEADIAAEAEAEVEAFLAGL
ncbi:DUF4157 domain-containing protein [Streptomyces pseudogriseolus]|uniref:eCIS core domain-containing protein n=1 Tax=Streptomyces pseudogriseolus TaxID=36817 RepID=UPI003FA29B29